MSGLDSDVKLLLHCNGDDESTELPDASDSNHTVTAHGNAQIDTAQKKFGTGSILLNGTTDYLTTDDTSDWDFGTSPFTIDGWVRYNSIGNYDRLVSAGSYASGANQMWFVGAGNGWGSSTEMNFGYYNGSGFTEYYAGSTFTANLNTWYHWALVRNGQYVYCFFNGVKVITWDMGSAVAINSGTGLIIGARYFATTSTINEYLDGWLDEIRVSKGVARWTSNFTPPTEEYTRDVTTNYLKQYRRTRFPGLIHGVDV